MAAQYSVKLLVESADIVERIEKAAGVCINYEG